MFSIKQFLALVSGWTNEAQKTLPQSYIDSICFKPDTWDATAFLFIKMSED